MPNRLAKETSPYLRQHSDNPVDWYAWGEEAFRKAKAEDKPIHLSVGYAACHWCHVMAHECFENPAIAGLMNERYVNIKVDRQERPDVDDIYQKVVQMMGQGGGWPLTVFLTPDREPFFGGTYFPPQDKYGRPGFPRLLLSLSEAWKQKREDVLDNVQQFVRGWKAIDERALGTPSEPAAELPVEAARFFAENTDSVWGGLGGAPKFPNVTCHDLMLRVYQRTQEPALLATLELTMARMAAGGIYDHLGGGFARYSVDERWAVPHFEKMLYDEGQLAKLYADAYRLTGAAAWRRVAEETCNYVLRDMTHEGGAFYASEDADSEGEEGKFYVFTPEQVREVLGDDAPLFNRAYGVSERGNFEHGATVLYRAVQLEPLEEAKLAGLCEKMLAARSKRVRPGRDENILASWNALMIGGLCATYQATGEPRWLEAARKAATFIDQQMRTPDGGVFRVWKDGSARVPGFLEDYAFLANAYLELYESGFEKRWLDRAVELAERIVDRFWEGGAPFFTAKDGEALAHRPRAPYDNAWPSGTSTTAFALLRLSELLGRSDLRDRAESIFRTYGEAMAKNPFGFSHLLAALEFARRGPLEIVIAGEGAALIEKVHRTYHPARVLCRAQDVPIGEGKTPVDGKAAAYVCRNQTCDAPVLAADALVLS